MAVIKTAWLVLSIHGSQPALCSFSGCPPCTARHLLVLQSKSWLCRGNGVWTSAFLTDKLPRDQSWSHSQPPCQWGVGCGGTDPHPAPSPHQAQAELSPGNPGRARRVSPLPRCAGATHTSHSWMEASPGTSIANPFLFSRQQGQLRADLPRVLLVPKTQIQCPEDPAWRGHCWHPPRQGAKSLHGAKTWLCCLCMVLPAMSKPKCSSSSLNSVSCILLPPLWNCDCRG